MAPHTQSRVSILRYATACHSFCPEKTLNTKAIYAGIAERLEDVLHALSTLIVLRYGVGFISEVSAATLAETPFAKPVVPKML